MCTTKGFITYPSILSKSSSGPITNTEVTTCKELSLDLRKTHQKREYPLVVGKSFIGQVLPFNKALPNTLFISKFKQPFGPKAFILDIQILDPQSSKFFRPTKITPLSESIFLFMFMTLPKEFGTVIV